jgi:hypothetical protein
MYSDSCGNRLNQARLPLLSWGAIGTPSREGAANARFSVPPAVFFAENTGGKYFSIAVLGVVSYSGDNLNLTMRTSAGIDGSQGEVSASEPGGKSPGRPGGTADSAPVRRNDGHEDI